MATLPVLPLTDAVLLPGMVIPVTLDPTTQAAVDAARATGDKKLLAVPRVDGEYGSVGTIATDREGRPAAQRRTGRRVRGLTRARIGSGVPGPGAALWVEATVLDEPAPAGKARELAREYQALVTSVLQQRGAWQVIDADRADDRPVRAGRLGRLRALAHPGPEDRAARRAGRHRPAGAAGRLGAATTSPSRRSPRRSAATSARAWRSPSGSSCCASSSPRSARSSARTSRTAPPTTGPGSRRPTCRTRSARRRCARSAGWSGPATSRPRPAGSAPGWTPCWRCRGRPVPRTTPTWPRPARCSTPTTPAWPT